MNALPRAWHECGQSALAGPQEAQAVLFQRAAALLTQLEEQQASRLG